MNSRTIARTGARIAAVGIAAATTVLTLGVAPAAAEDAYIEAWEGRASASYQAYRDIVRLCDNNSDGYGAAVQMKYHREGTGEYLNYWKVNSSGAGTCETYNRAVLDSGNFAFRVCLAGQLSTCSTWKTVYRP